AVARVAPASSTGRGRGPGVLGDGLDVAVPAGRGGRSAVRGAGGWGRAGGRLGGVVAAGRGAAAAGDHLGAVVAFGDGLRLWRGRALEDFAGAGWAAGEAARLEEL